MRANRDKITGLVEMRTAVQIGRTRLEKCIKHIGQSDSTENRTEELLRVEKYGMKQCISYLYT